MKRRQIFYVPPLLLALLWLLAMPACKKEAPSPSIIKGRITEYGTSDPVPEAKIYLSCDDSQFGGPSIFKLFDSLATDADGHHYKEYPDGEFCANVIIQPYKKGYFVPTPLDYVTVPKSYDFVLDPEAWLKVVTVPDINGSEISFSGNFSGASGHTTGIQNGIKEYIFSTRGNENKNIRWIYWDNPQDVRRDTIYLLAHDTTTYTIHY